MVVSCVVPTAPPVRPLPYRVDTSDPDSARGYTCTLEIEPGKKLLATPLDLARPTVNAPDVANGVVSVAVPCAAPFTYKAIPPLVALNTPTRCAQLFTVGAVVEVANTVVALTTSAVGRANAHRFAPALYCR